MKVSELKTILDSLNDNDDCYYSGNAFNLEDLQVTAYQGDIIFYAGTMNIAVKYEEKRAELDRQETKAQARLDDVKSRKNKLKEKPNN